MENIKRFRTKSILWSVIDRGHLKQKNVNIRILWNKIYGEPIFRATMGINRVKQILRFIRFDDKSIRTFCRAEDKLAPIRGIFEECNKNLRKFYLPGENITIDEQMIGFHGKCPFRQYLTSKLGKYGMKLF